MKTYKTDKELIRSQNQNVFLIDKLLNKPNISPEDIGDIIPGMFHLNRKSDLAVEYLSKPGRDYFDMSLNEIHDMGVGFFDKTLSLETRQIVVPRFLEYSVNGNSQTLCSDFQIVRRDEDQPFEIFMSSVKHLKDKDVLAVVTLPINTLGQSTAKMERLLGENKFFRDHYEQFMQLTKREKEILSLVAKGYNNKDIGEQLYISSHTVRTHRNRIFSKLEIKHISELMKYAYAYDLL